MPDLISYYLSEYYLFVKALHIISVITWMAGIFYLPRLFVYHVEGFQKRGVKAGSEMDLLFQHQERLLLKAIMTPSMVLTWFFGICLVLTPGIIDWSLSWIWVKFICVLLMSWFHFWLSDKRKTFLNENNKLTGKTYRLMNEVPTVLMVLIVFSVVLKF